MLSNMQTKSLQEAAEHYSQAISEEALAYLNGRGISELVAAKYQLGTITDPIEGHQGYEGWISIPYFTALDACIGFKFRRLDDGKPKYGMPIGQKTHLYNVNAITFDSRRVVICEGEFDAIVMSEVGVPAVGVPGVASWKTFYPKLFTGYDVVYVIGDNDEREDKDTNPGAEFSRRVASEVLNSKIVQLPPGMDITDYYLAEGRESLLNLVGGVR
jgi:DNA primase